MKNLIVFTAVLLLLAASEAMAQISAPIESYVYGSPAASAPYASGLVVPAIPGPSAGSMLKIPVPALSSSFAANINVYPVSGAAADGKTDDYSAFNTALTLCQIAGGGAVTYGPHQYYIGSASLSVPAGCALEGPAPPQSSDNGAKFNPAQPGLLVNPTYTINLSGTGSAFINAAEFNPVVLALPTGTAQQTYTWINSFGGTGITRTGGGTLVQNVFEVGYQTCDSATAVARPNSYNFLGHCWTGLYRNNITDWGATINVNMHPALPSGSIATVTEAISAVADNGSGAIRITVPDTSGFANGNPVFVSQVGGYTGANSRFFAVVVDSTHLDLCWAYSSSCTTYSQAAPSTTGTWTSGSSVITVASMNSLGYGQTISGTNIPSGDTVAYLDYAQSQVWLSQPTTGSGTGATLTFVNQAYTSSTGSVGFSANYETAGYAYEIVNATFDATNLFAFGYENDVYLSGAQAKLTDANFDNNQLFDPYSTCVTGTGTGNDSWQGGRCTLMTALALSETGGHPFRVSNVNFVASQPGVVVISDDATPLLATGDALTNYVGETATPAEVGMAFTGGGAITGVNLSADQFAYSAPLFDSNLTQAAFFPGISTVISAYLTQGGSPDANLVLNGQALLDQPKEGGTYALAANGPILDGWRANVTNAAGLAATAQKVTDYGGGSAPLPGSQSDLQFKVTASGSTTGSDIWELRATIEQNYLTNLQWGTAAAQPVALSFVEACSVGGQYTVTLAGSGQLYPIAYTLAANVPTQESFTVQGDKSGTWPLVGNGLGLAVQFPMDMASQSATIPAGQWGAGNNEQLPGSVHVMATNGATCDIANVRLELGTIAHQYVSRNPAALDAFAQRYYRKTFPPGTAPANNAGLTGARCTSGADYYWAFDPPMAAAISGADVTTYNPSVSANANWRDVTAGANVTAVIDPNSAAGPTGVEISTTGATAGHQNCIHVTVDGRL